MACRVLVTTVPKCGKNLLMTFLSSLKLERVFRDSDTVDLASHLQARWLLRDRADRHARADLEAFLSGTAPAFERGLAALVSLPDDSFVQGHFAYDPELHQRARAAGLTIVFLYRDPRACLASMAHFLVERGEPESWVPRLARQDLPSALRLLLSGDEVVAPFEDVYAPYEGWRGAEGVVRLRFEDVVGPRGHGSLVRQIAGLTGLADEMGWQGSPWKLLEAVDRAFHPGVGTFRRGTIDGWREDLADLTETEGRRSLEALAHRWGYPVDGPTVEPMSLNQVDAVLASVLGRLRCEHHREMTTIRELEERYGGHLETSAWGV